MQDKLPCAGMKVVLRLGLFVYPSFGSSDKKIQKIVTRIGEEVSTIL